MAANSISTDRGPRSKHRWFQYSLGALLVLMLLGSIGTNWVAVKVQEAKRQQESLEAIETLGGTVEGVGTEGPEWLQSLLGCDIFLNAGYWVSFAGQAVTDAGLEHLKGVSQLFDLTLEGSEVTDAKLEHLKALDQLGVLHLKGTQVTDEGVRRLQQALPECKIER